MDGKRQVGISLLGSTLDSGTGPERWERWRPTVSLFQHEDLLVARMELLYERKFLNLARQVAGDVATCSPETQIRMTEIEFGDPWDFEQVYGALHDFARAYSFNTESEEYLIHITTGTHVAQICLFLLTESRHFPGKLIQTNPPSKTNGSPVGSHSIIDLDLS